MSSRASSARALRLAVAPPRRTDAFGQRPWNCGERVSGFQRLADARSSPTRTTLSPPMVGELRTKRVRVSVALEDATLAVDDDVCGRLPTIARRIARSPVAVVLLGSAESSRRYVCSLGRWTREAHRTRRRRPRRSRPSSPRGSPSATSSRSRASSAPARRRSCAARARRSACARTSRARRTRSATATTAPASRSRTSTSTASQGFSAAEWGDLEPYFDDAIVFVEWPEAGAGVLPPPRYAVRLRHAGAGRAVEISEC